LSKHSALLYLYVVYNNKRSPVGPVGHDVYTGPGFGVRTQSKWFPLPRETFNVGIYSFLGLFKIVFLVFNLIPYVALVIVG
jgi:hypothetical protein